MDYLNKGKNDSKNKKGLNNDELGKIHGITKAGKYYFPGKISSGCFDGNGLICDREQNRKEDIEELYEQSLERQYDVNGMYTGRPENDGEVPVQDADDL